MTLCFLHYHVLIAGLLLCSHGLHKRQYNTENKVIHDFFQIRFRSHLIAIKPRAVEQCARRVHYEELFHLLILIWQILTFILIISNLSIN